MPQMGKRILSFASGQKWVTGWQWVTGFAILSEVNNNKKQKTNLWTKDFQDAGCQEMRQNNPWDWGAGVKGQDKP